MAANNDPKLIDALLHRKRLLIAYAQSKIDDQDWHAVADAMMDIREICAKLEVLGAHASAPQTAA